MSGLSSLHLPSIFSVSINAVGWALIHFVWQGFLIGGITAFLMLVMRNTRPQARYLVCCSSMLLCLLVPFISIVAQFHGNSDARFQTQIVVVNLMGVLDRSASLKMTAWLQSHLPLIVSVWLVCSGMLGGRLLIGLFCLSGYNNLSRSQEHPDWQKKVSKMVEQFGLQRNVIVRIVNDLDSPVTIGVLKPLILLPASLLTGMPTELLEALVAHEIAHIQRFDYLVNLFQSVIEMLLFFHPVVWWISKRIRKEREHIADDLAARILGEPRRLALALQKLDSFQFSNPQLAQAAHGGNLMSRIKQLLRPEIQPFNWKAAVTVIGLATASVGMVAHAVTAPISPIVDQAASDTQSNIVVKPHIDFAKCGQPEYPKYSIEKSEQGTVVLDVLVDATGKVQEAKVNQSSGFKLLDEATANKVLTCKQTAGTINGKSHEAWIKLVYVWKLK